MRGERMSCWKHALQQVNVSHFCSFYAKGMHPRPREAWPPMCLIFGSPCKGCVQGHARHGLQCVSLLGLHARGAFRAMLGMTFNVSHLSCRLQGMHP
eukprot:1159897-Pelagomonas_calceolata.AAC.6